jgi:putative glycosyltransferase (TIGR04372 family)
MMPSLNSFKAYCRSYVRNQAEKDFDSSRFISTFETPNVIYLTPHSLGYGDLIEYFFLQREISLTHGKRLVFVGHQRGPTMIRAVCSRLIDKYCDLDEVCLSQNTSNFLINFLLNTRARNAVVQGFMFKIRELHHDAFINDMSDSAALFYLKNNNKFEELKLLDNLYVGSLSNMISGIHRATDRYTNRSYISKVNERIEFDRSTHGNNILKILGLKESEYVVLNIRTKTTGKRGDNPRDIYDLYRYVDMLQVIRQLGLKIVRIGSRDDKDLDFIDQYCIPIYKTDYQSVANDVTLIRDSLFSICNASGPVSIARLFHKPVLVVDADGLFCCPNHPGYVSLPRNYYLEGEKISPKELPDHPEWFMFNTFYKVLQNRKSTYQYNSAEMLKKCAIEMYEFSKNEKSPRVEQIEFNKKLKPYHHLSLEFTSYIASSWINGL